MAQNHYTPTSKFKDEDIELDTKTFLSYEPDFKNLPCASKRKVTYCCPSCGEKVTKKKVWLTEHSKDVFPENYPPHYLTFCYDCKKPYYTNTVLNKRINTWQSIYGTDNPSKNASVKEKQLISLSKVDRKVAEEKRVTTCRKKYGVDNPMQLKDTLLKRERTWEEKYGVKNVASLPDNIKKNREKGRTIWHYFYDGNHFDSSWELQFYRYLIDQGEDFILKPEPLEYEFEGKTHFYFPDFKVGDTYVEIKSDFLLKDGKLYVPFNDERLQKKYDEKQKCMDCYEVKVISKEGMKDIIKENAKKYGKKWFEVYRVLKEVKR